MKEAAPNQAAFFVFINSIHEKSLKKKTALSDSL